MTSEELPEEIEKALQDLQDQHHTQGWEGVNDKEVKRANRETRAVIAQALKADRAQLVERVRGMKKFTISKSYRCPKCNTYYGKEDEYCSRDRSKLVVTEYKHADEVQEPYNQALEDVLSIIEERINISHVNPNCKDPTKCKPHGEMGEVEYED